MAYDAALRREELCTLQTEDLDPGHRTLRVQAHHTKNRLERVCRTRRPPAVLLASYLNHRATISRARARLFLSESHRNHGRPLSLWTWSKSYGGSPMRPGCLASPRIRPGICA